MVSHDRPKSKSSKRRRAAKPRKRADARRRTPTRKQTTAISTVETGDALALMLDDNGRGRKAVARS